MIDNETTGSIAALAAQFFMALGFIIWDTIWSKSGASAFALNLFKCNLASIGFIIASFVFGFRIGTDEADSNETKESIGYLILSGFIGIIVGDLAWLEALRQLGATRVIVMDTIKPFSAAFFGWAILDESIQNVAFSGIVLTVFGVLIVSLEAERKDRESKQRSTEASTPPDEVDEEDAESKSRNEEENPLNDDAQLNEEILITSEEQTLPQVQIKLKVEGNLPTNDLAPPSTSTRSGYICAVLNIFLDTYGFVLTKQHGKIFSSWAINLIRFGSSGLIMIIISCLMRLFEKNKGPSTNQHLNNSTKLPWYRLPQMSRPSWMKISLGVLFVTFLCPALSNYAVFQISLGLAMSLGSVTPLYAMFLEWCVHGQVKKPTFKSLCGAILAIGGVVILSIYNKSA